MDMGTFFRYIHRTSAFFGFVSYKLPTVDIRNWKIICTSFFVDLFESFALQIFRTSLQTRWLDFFFPTKTHVAENEAWPNSWQWRSMSWVHPPTKDSSHHQGGHGFSNETWNAFHLVNPKDLKISQLAIYKLHPGRLTWTIIMEVWKIIFLFKWVICRFHVNLPGCTHPT